jgi:multiple sugar transport system substrate-binding protein
MAANGENATEPRPTVAGYVNLSEAVGAAISKVLQGQGDPQAALDEAAEPATAALADK